MVDLRLPADDTYTVYVHGWQTVEDTTPVTTYIWDVPLASGGTLVVSDPGDAVLGATDTVNVSWTNATDGNGTSAPSPMRMRTACSA